MNDERIQPLLDAWFRDRDEPALDASGDIAHVMADVPQTRRQGRWWPLPLFRRQAPTPEATDTTEYRRSPIAATNGHAPIVIRRTQIMFSPVKAIVAGALVFALGGVFLIAQPYGPREAAAPAAERTALPGVTVTATQDCGPVSAVPITCTYTASDPRLTGTLTHEWVADISGPSHDDVTFTWAPATLEGPDGSWTGHYYAVWGDTAQVFSVLSGVGGYEGWQYAAYSIDPEADGDADVLGVIYEGELPPFGPLPTAIGD